MKYKQLTELTYATETIECIFVEIVIDKQKNMIIGCIYRPPNSDINVFNEKMQNILEHKCFQKNKKVSILGDYNINLLHHETHSPTANFLNVMLSNGLLPAISKPTRVTDGTASLIDNIFTNIDLSSCRSAILYSDISDHYPVFLQCRIKSKCVKKILSPANISKRQFTQSSIEKFRNYLSGLGWSSVYDSLEKMESNLAYDKFLEAYNCGFDFLRRVEYVK